MEKGQIVSDLLIEDISAEGNGIGRADGMIVFVRGAAFGDTVRAEIVKVKKSYAIGRLLKIETPSPYRVEADCRYFGHCGGCTFRNISYEAELALKERQVREKLMRLAGIENPCVQPIIGMGNPMRYRNKAQLPVGGKVPAFSASDSAEKAVKLKTGGIETDESVRTGNAAKRFAGMQKDCAPFIGFYVQGSRELINVDDCLLQNRVVADVAETLRQFLREEHIAARNETSGSEVVRHLIVKTAESTGEVMVILVVSTREIPGIEKLVEKIDDAVYEAGYSLESVVLNIHRGRSGQVLGDEFVTVAGKPTILSRCMGLKFEISPAAFYQVNPVQTEALYGKVLEYAALTGTETVFDLYCGVGTIGLICADRMRQLARMGQAADVCQPSGMRQSAENERAADAQQMARNEWAAANGQMGRVYGIESVPGAVIDANRNAVINGIVNAEFICGKAEEKIDELIAGYTDRDGFAVPGRKPDVVVVDPPRSGCDEHLLSAIAKASPSRIIYVSCDPATLARDLRRLIDLGYAFCEATPVDMFPRCNHVETVCLMSRADV